MKMKWLLLMILLNCTVWTNTSIATSYCFQSFAIGIREKPKPFNFFEHLKVAGIDPQTLVFRTKKVKFTTTEGESYETHTISVSQEVGRNQVHGFISIHESSSIFQRFVYSSSIEVSPQRTGIGTMLYLLAARIALESYGLPLGTVSKEEKVNRQLILKHSEKARLAWQKIFSLGWAELIEKDFDGSPYELFIFFPEHIRELSEDIWNLYLLKSKP